MGRSNCGPVLYITMARTDFIEMIIEHYRKHSFPLPSAIMLGQLWDYLHSEDDIDPPDNSFHKYLFETGLDVVPINDN